MKNFNKFKKHFIVSLALACTLVLGGAKAWQDPSALPEALDCGKSVCCAKCIVTTASLAPDRIEGWEWKMHFAGSGR